MHVRSGTYSMVIVPKSGIPVIGQTREIAQRQNIRGPYLDQILAVLKREGIVRSIRGAGGGYTLANSPTRITVGDVVRAVVGDQLLIGGGGAADPAVGGASYIVR